MLLLWPSGLKYVHILNFGSFGSTAVNTDQLQGVIKSSTFGRGIYGFGDFARFFYKFQSG